MDVLDQGIIRECCSGGAVDPPNQSKFLCVTDNIYQGTAQQPDNQD